MMVWKTGKFYKNLWYTSLWLVIGIILVGCDSNAQIEMQLAETYGAEVGVAIENLELKRFDLETYEDPSSQSEVLTGPYLVHHDIRNWETEINEQAFWSITRSAIVEKLRIVEYNPERFKATACVVLEYEDVTPVELRVINSGTYRKCGVYVFVHEDSIWKLAGFFNTTIPQDVWRNWDYTDDWLKEIIGNLPNDLPY